MLFAIATKSLFLEVRDDRLVLGRRDRPESPHVTLLWGTRSGELDLHLKWQNGRPEPYESLFKVDKGDLGRALAQAFGPEAKGMVEAWGRRSRAYRPGWLRRNGYWIVWLPGAALRDQLKQHVSFRKRKYRLDFQRIVSPEVMGGLAMDNLYDPEILHLLPQLKAAGEIEEEPMQVFAQRLDARRDGLIHLAFHPSGGKRGRWVGARMAAFRAHLEGMTRRVMAPAAVAVAPAMQRIHDVLHLGELGAQRWDVATYEGAAISAVTATSAEADAPAARRAAGWAPAAAGREDLAGSSSSTI